METISELLSNAIHNHRSGQLQLAEQRYRQILERDPNHPDAMHLLGVIAHQSGQPEASIELIKRSIELSRETAGACCNLGIAYHAVQKIPEAIACYRRALELKWDDVETHLNLGVALKSLGKPAEAMSSYQQALQLNPDCVQALNNIGIELKSQGNYEDAIDYFQRAIALSPAFAEVHNNLGNVFKERGQLGEAIECYRKAIEINPDYTDAHNNLGNPLKDQGRIDEAIECFRRAIEINPSHAIAHSNLVYTQNFSPTIDEPTLLNELRAWNDRHCKPLQGMIQPHRNDRIPDRRLRIGYVSPDFRDHCQSFFTTPLFANHDRQQFEIYCYSDVVKPDLITNNFRSTVEHWREIAHLDHDQVAQQIRDDRIDILVDLTMHMAGNRLPVFCRRPAPIQICWLAYPGSTGLDVMDYRISDRFLDPPGASETIYAEQTIRLPETFWCYDPLTGEHEPNSLPALTNGSITFGCLNNFCKLNREVLALWCRVLQEVDRSRLMILAPEGSHRDAVLKQFEADGVTSDRIQFVPLLPRSRYLLNYHAIDLCLDTFPYNGHTTSLDAMWMGVPVVTLVGSRIVGRAGLSQLTNLGLNELVARTSDQFVRIATNLAKDWSRLSELRATLRSRMQQSALMDAPRFARNLENAYRQIFRLDNHEKKR